MCTIDGFTGSCIGTTCDTNCDTCSSIPCVNSRSPPNGCMILVPEIPGQVCVSATRNPTFDPTHSPTPNPTELSKCLYAVFFNR